MHPLLCKPWHSPPCIAGPCCSSEDIPSMDQYLQIVLDSLQQLSLTHYGCSWQCFGSKFLYMLIYITLYINFSYKIPQDVVMHNMMSIFTFMGTSLLRRDDSYSFQVIHQTIQSIVPTLIKVSHAQFIWRSLNITFLYEFTLIKKNYS